MAEIVDIHGKVIKSEKTVGGLAHERLSNPEKTEVGETSQAASSDYMKQLMECCEEGLKANYKDDFYVAVIKKRERTMLNVLRCMFYHRQTMPSPMWDMDCWRVTQKGDLFYCWTLPDMQTGHDMMERPQDFKDDSPELLQFVYMFVNDML